jgi:lipoprotein-anchoring transpeptidase ErfK/SrfK
MKSINTLFILSLGFLALSACSTYRSPTAQTTTASAGTSYLEQNYSERIPQRIATREKVIVIDPNVHVWGAYQNGDLVKSGLTTAGGNWCSDIGRSCRTTPGSFRISSLGGPGCKSTRYPVGKGGAPMPYCMFFNGNQSLHGSSEVIEANVSHGCVRLRVPDAAWIRYDFANVGTKVIVKPY